MPWFFCDVAYAQGAGAPGGASAIANFLPLVLIVIVFYFFIIRPQSKRAKDHGKFLESLKRGDKVITQSGIIGSVASIDDAKGIITLEIAKDTQVKFTRSSITSYVKTDEAAKEKDPRNG